MRQAIWRLSWYSNVFLAVMCLSFVVSGYSSALTPRDIAQKAFPSVVLLAMKDANGQLISLGSGFFVRGDVVATNLHVIEGATAGYARIVGQKTKHNVAGTVGIDAQRDLVLLKIRGTKSPPLRLGDTSKVAVGDEAYAIGNPLGLEGTFSEGIVSGIRQIDSRTMFQITAPISPGSSGGPVLNGHGEVIGVAVATFKGGQNLNFAIPASYLTLLLQNMKPVAPLSATKPDKKDRSIEYLAEQIQSGLGVKAGYFIPIGGGANLLRGVGVIYGADYLYIPPRRSYGIDVEFGYVSTEDWQYHPKYGWIYKWTVITGEASVVWFPTKGRNIYVGAGVDYHNVELSSANDPLGDESGSGFHVSGGYVVLNRLFIEIKYANAKVEEDKETRGVSIRAGFRF